MVIPFSIARVSKVMNKEQEQQIVNHYSATDKYIKSALHSQVHQSVFDKENDKFQWRRMDCAVLSFNLKNFG